MARSQAGGDNCVIDCVICCVIDCVIHCGRGGASKAVRGEAGGHPGGPAVRGDPGDRGRTAAALLLRKQALGSLPEPRGHKKGSLAAL